MDSRQIRYLNARRLVEEAGGVTAFADKIGKQQSQVSAFAGENPVKGIGAKIARQIEAAFGKNPGWLDIPHHEASPDGIELLLDEEHPTGVVAETSGNYQGHKDIAVIKRFEVQGSMGHGKINGEHQDVVETLMVSRPWLRKNVNCTSIENLALITGLGDSMEGTFSDGDLLLVDRGVRQADLDAVYAFSLGEHFYIKRLQRRPDGTFLMISDNSKYPPYVIASDQRDQLEVQARVILAWNAKRL